MRCRDAALTGGAGPEALCAAHPRAGRGGEYFELDCEGAFRARSSSAESYDEVAKGAAWTFSTAILRCHSAHGHSTLSLLFKSKDALCRDTFK
jgi:hypothetical protein